MMEKKNFLICGTPTPLLKIFIDHFKDKFNFVFLGYQDVRQYSKIKELLGENAFIIRRNKKNTTELVFFSLKIIKLFLTRKLNYCLIFGNREVPNSIFLILIKAFFPKTKRIFFPYDIKMYSINKGKKKLLLFFDRICYENCDKIITKGYESELLHLQRFYKISDKPHFVFNKQIEIKDVVDKKIKNLEKGKIDLVYIGGAPSVKNSSDHVKTIKMILCDKKINFHIYPNKSSLKYIERFKKYENFFIHDYIEDHSELIKEISKYDIASLLSKPSSKGYLQAKMSSTIKIFDYLSAGLPIITDKEHESRADFVKNNDFGIVISINDSDKLSSIIKKANYKSLLRNVKKNRVKYYFSKEYKEKLIDWLES